ncbi:MAG: non-ribosomal peptide synthetase, partial [Limisphaerales bacterium]
MFPNLKNLEQESKNNFRRRVVEFDAIFASDVLPIAKETLIVSAWSYVLSCYSTEQQALVGVRFHRKDLPKDRLWPFCSMSVPHMTAIEWLREQDALLSELQSAEPILISDLRAFLAVPSSEHLIDSVIDFTATEPEPGCPLILRAHVQTNSAEFIYFPSAIDEKVIERLSAQLNAVVKQMVEDPNRPLSSIAILSKAEEEEILFRWNDTAKPFPIVKSLKAFVEKQVAKTPDGIAVEFPGINPGESPSLSYRELNAKANQIAHYLRKHGIGPDRIVGVCMERSIELTIAILGIIKAGAAYVPLDPNYPKDRLEFIINDTAAPIILTEQNLKTRLPSSGSTLLCLDADSHLFSKENTLNPPDEVNDDHLGYLIYTSGSTGKPKGVAMRQGPLINLLHWQLENFSSNREARTLQFASINFDVSFQEMFSTWCAGGTLVLISEEERRDSKALVNFLQKNRVERLFLPFVALKHLADAAVQEGVFPERLREVITAGEQLQISRQLATFFRRLPRCTLENQYGPSETHVVTAFRLKGAPETWPALPSIGKPISNVRIYILNTQLKPVPIGVPGELYIGGICLARGYLNRDDLTKDKFVSDPFTSGREKLYRTGDLARFLPDGNVEFLGRIDHQVKIRGFRIELGEIETLLCQHPAVREAVAMARDTSSGDKQLVAYVVSDGPEIDSSDLRSYIKGLVPSYAVPNAFVVLPKLPINPNGKVDRRALPDPSDSMFENSATADIKMPRDPLEMQIKLVFEKFLNRRPLGIDVSFFEVGGDSLQALKLVLEVERVTGTKIPLSILYRHSTIEGLAEAIRGNSTQDEFSSLVPLQPLGSKPPLFLVHTTPGDVLGYGNLIYHLQDQPCYGLQSLGLHKEELAHKSVPEMAAYYINLIRQQQPNGPYYLGGWCYGGIIAVEMAHQLLAAGEKVGPLILIETPAPAPSLKNPFYFFRRIGCALNMTPTQWINYIAAKLRYYRGIRTENEKRFKRIDPQENQTNREIEKQNRFLAK